MEFQGAVISIVQANPTLLWMCLGNPPGFVPPLLLHISYTFPSLTTAGPSLAPAAVIGTDKSINPGMEEGKD